MPNITWGLTYWPWYLLTSALLVLSGFLAPESWALTTNPANTLSTYSQWELGLFTPTGMSIHTVAWWISLVVWLLFSVLFVLILTQHIWFRKIYFP